MSLAHDEAYFSDICIEKCMGKCCDPWWGVVSFSLRKENGLADLNRFTDEITGILESRMNSIREAYVTKEQLPRHLLNKPERYNAFVEKIDVSQNSLAITICAMFAFRCQFFSSDRKCLIHPAITGGHDIRPQHCGYMGAPDAKEGEKGYCRIIYAAANASDPEAVDRALETEQAAGERHFREGFPSAGRAAEKAVAQIKDWCVKNAGHLLPVEKKAEPGRNEPCFCGSGKKYKKCHGHF